jgi:murein DD-endopeptidase MepM/ murein hydrolase activator NlpD
LLGERRRGGNSVVESQLPKLIARVRFPSPAPFICAGIVLWMSGCATTEYKPVPNIPESSHEAPKPAVPVKKEGVYHKVLKGQTLWRIAKAYGVGVEEIIQSNNIPNAAAIEVDQLILIPGVKDIKDIPARTADENKEEFAWPIKGKVISYFHDHHGNALNRGVDIEANEGDTVKASREGQVVMADYLAGYGQTLMVDHGDGFITVYAQNRTLLSKVGDHVYKGDPIAEVGRVGRKSFMHFELRKGQNPANPLYYLP